MSEELRALARDVILEYGRDNAEATTIFEMAETRLDREITDDELDRVTDLVGAATVTITWPDTPE